MITMSWRDHVPHQPTPDELAQAGPADAQQQHDVEEFEHHESEEAFYEMPARAARQAA
ncbi:hypothetical protein GCM10010430_22550 [Kitasatospora cystarginea]|uniref:Uncharacterized protein n=2 Tax=Streptomycetaceae TaxID=2062 RepID=A0ABN3DSB7_9ACTN